MFAFRLDALEDQMKTFAPIATTVAVQSHQLDEGEKRMRKLEDGLDEAHRAASDLLDCINKVKVDVKGITVRLAVYTAISGFAAGIIASAVIAFAAN